MRVQTRALVLHIPRMPCNLLDVHDPTIYTRTHTHMHARTQGSNTRFAEWLPSDDIVIKDFTAITHPDEVRPRVLVCASFSI